MTQYITWHVIFLLLLLRKGNKVSVRACIYIHTYLWYRWVGVSEIIENLFRSFPYNAENDASWTLKQFDLAFKDKMILQQEEPHMWIYPCCWTRVHKRKYRLCERQHLNSYYIYWIWFQGLSGNTLIWSNKEGSINMQKRNT
mgnify:CR=1 FL=1